MVFLILTSLFSCLFWQAFFGLACFDKSIYGLSGFDKSIFGHACFDKSVLHCASSENCILIPEFSIWLYFVSLTLNWVVILSALTESEEQEIKVLTKLKETVDKQREELRVVKRDLSQKAIDCEAVSMWLGCSGDLQLCGFTYVISHKHFSLRASRFKNGCNVKLLCVLKSDCFIVGWCRASVHMCSNWHAGLASFLPLTVEIPWQLKVKERRNFPGCLGQRWRYFASHHSQSVSTYSALLLSWSGSTALWLFIFSDESCPDLTSWLALILPFVTNCGSLGSKHQLTN